MKKTSNYFIYLMVFLLCGCAMKRMRLPAQIESQERSSQISKISPPSMSPRQILIPPEVTLWLDTQKQFLGAYSVLLFFDSKIVKIHSIKGGNPPFDRAPYVDKKAFNSGKVRIMSYHIQKKGSKGQILVARIKFEGLHRGVSPLKIQVETLVTPKGQPIPPRFFLLTSQVEVFQSSQQ